MSGGRIRAALLAAAAAALALGGCELPLTDAPGPVPEAAPPSEVSDESRRLEAYYAQVEARLLSRGLLRTDGGGQDTPFTARMLAENFERIALYDEYVVAAGQFVARATPSRLRRWQEPVRVRLIWGASVPEERRAGDRARIGAYLQRLGRLTGHPVGLTESGGNVLVYIVNLDEQRTLGPRLRTDMPGVPGIVVSSIVNSPRSTFCAAYALSDAGNDDSVYSQAIIHLKDEHRGLMREACIHEELAQMMGLPNDSALARPSIFNDDEEFALLTRHDEYLLRILYDRRLSPGMTPAEARPVVARIARELLGPDS
ncbi:MAG: DUF2927 domain-containing protein [Rhodobacteraceae bacterium]|nr:DUF2927 domain-containing protein [Paracoccaceae bacterium]